MLATNSVLSIVGVVISTQVYQRKDEPYYYTGNKITITIAVVTCMVFVAQRFYLKRLNERKDARWREMTVGDQLAYRYDKEARGMEGNKRLDFRFQY